MDAFGSRTCPLLVGKAITNYTNGSVRELTGGLVESRGFEMSVA
jgi:hypothetical protein